MKNPQTYLLILIFIIFGCSRKEKTELNGVWYNVDSSERENYYEAHITDTGFVVVNQTGLSYLSSYKLKNDTLIQYIRDPFSNRKIIDTMKFEIVRNQDSFGMVNTINPKSNSKWTKIQNIKPFEFYENQSEDTFALGLKKRYFENYVSKFVPENYVDYTMDYFDIDWSLKKE
ncbi:hypothetical protein [Algibacter sp. L4_22]|uniref:hypothetical protein n=1 Tax=Algibacter sp. L4_22 TaxID=2942477 RepID=UPI00201B9242|nr:hypothetical protein [Algibacter sp. L4_22]MCL5130581.1 hypothetical protein [Algibacter sp. L4_22]